MLVGLGQELGIWIPPLRPGTFGISEKRECLNVFRVYLQQPIGSIHHFGGIAGLLVGAHQQFKRVRFHHAIGILGEKGFETTNFGARVLLLHGADIGVVLGGILNLFFLRL